MFVIFYYFTLHIRKVNNKSILFLQIKDFIDTDLCNKFGDVGDEDNRSCKGVDLHDKNGYYQLITTEKTLAQIRLRRGLFLFIPILKTYDNAR